MFADDIPFFLLGPATDQGCARRCASTVGCEAFSVSTNQTAQYYEWWGDLCMGCTVDDVEFSTEENFFVLEPQYRKTAEPTPTPSKVPTSDPTSTPTSAPTRDYFDLISESMKCSSSVLTLPWWLLGPIDATQCFKYCAAASGCLAFSVNTNETAQYYDPASDLCLGCTFSDGVEANEWDFYEINPKYLKFTP